MTPSGKLDRRRVLADFGLDPSKPFEVEDLLRSTRYTWQGASNYVRLDPLARVGHILKPVAG